MRKRIGVILAGIGIWVGSAALAAEQPPLVLRCQGLFYDLGETTPQDAMYRIADGDVQTWRAADGRWISYVCTDHCRTSRSSITVRDGYTTAERGYVGHLLDLNPRSGRLSEEWQVGNDVLEFRARCRQVADPAPASSSLLPSTKHGDYTLYSIARGLPLPIPRTAFEPQLRLAQASYRSSTSLP